MYILEISIIKHVSMKLSNFIRMVNLEIGLVISFVGLIYSIEQKMFASIVYFVAMIIVLGLLFYSLIREEGENNGEEEKEEENN